MNLRNFCFALAALVFLSPISAHAQSGMNLSWDDCGSFGTELKSFACNTNTGVEVLVISAAVSPAMPQIDGVQVVVDLVTSGSTLSPWWHFESGGCHAGGLVGKQDFTQFTHCYDLWQGSATEGIVSTVGNFGPNTARLRGVAAIPGSTASPDGVEMYVFGFSFLHSKSTGTGSCSGCSDAACFVLEQVQLVQPPGVGDVTISNWLTRGFTSWKCEGFFGTDMPTPCTVSCPTPARSRTWGTIKSLYR